MRDARKEIVGAWITAINTAIPTRKVFTVVPKAEINGGTNPPNEYIYISDIYQEENGTKRRFMYSYELLIQVVYNDIVEKLTMWADVNAILGIITNQRDLVLGNDFDLMQIQLLSSTEEDILTDTGLKNICPIRIKMDIEDLQ